MNERRSDYQHLNGIREDIAEIKADVKMLIQVIHGNGDPGIKTRLDRVERGMGTITRIVWIVVTLLLSAIVSKIAGAW